MPRKSLPPSSTVQIISEFDSWLYYTEQVWLRAVFKDQMAALPAPSKDFLLWERADEAWVALVLDEAIHTLPTDTVCFTPLVFTKEVLHAFQESTKIYPAG